MAERFYKIPDRILLDKRISYAEKILYGIVLRLSQNEERKCFASNQHLAKLMNCSSSSITKWLNKLEITGYITRQMIYAKDTRCVDKRYITPVTTPAADLREGIPPNYEGVSREMKGGYTVVLREGIPPFYEDSKINIETEVSKINEREKLVKELTALIAEFHFGNDLSEALTDWVGYKLKRGEIQRTEWFKNQLIAIRKVLLQHNETEVASLIYECIANDWKTIPFDRLERVEKKSGNFFLNLAAANNF